ncbi:hypothetical protein RJ641_026022 [Dillenia turbinata]|uniref:Uncharacterized protein n=1 Tax=Dillenia turbinata TaxID=194707 RepID=A0AAN8W407_9MAGN
MASSISLLLPITDVDPHVTPLFPLPTHFNLAVDVAGKSSPEKYGVAEIGTTAAASTTAGISPEELLVVEKSPEELVVLRESSGLRKEEIPELADKESESGNGDTLRRSSSSWESIPIQTVGSPPVPWYRPCLQCIQLTIVVRFVWKVSARAQLGDKSHVATSTILIAYQLGSLVTILALSAGAESPATTTGSKL